MFQMAWVRLDRVTLVIGFFRLQIRPKMAKSPKSTLKTFHRSSSTVSEKILIILNKLLDVSFQVVLLRLIRVTIFI